MTVVAEIGGDKVKNFHALCPDVDILGINSYAGAASVAERYKKLGGTKPFILTEYGPNGIWEIAEECDRRVSRATSTEKAEAYRRAYKSHRAQPGWDVPRLLRLSLGTKAGGHLDVVLHVPRAMAHASPPRRPSRSSGPGKRPRTVCPSSNRSRSAARIAASPARPAVAAVEASDPEGDPLKVTWLLQRDPGEYGSGGDKEEAPPTYPDAIVKADKQTASIVFPNDGGLYRLFATVRDDKGGGAVANVALHVDAPVVIAKGQRATLPLTVYAEETDAPTYIPAGWMGDAKAIKVNPAWGENPHSGKTSMRCDFEADKGWGGVVWQNPAGDWGDRGGGYDLTGAKKLTFWARGEKGGEAVNFEFGTLAPPKKFTDTGKGKLEKITLTKEWKRYEIDVSTQDLTRIKTGFVWTVASPGQPVTFYLDDIRWE